MVEPEQRLGEKRTERVGRSRSLDRDGHLAVWLEPLQLGHPVVEREQRVFEKGGEVLPRDLDEHVGRVV